MANRYLEKIALLDVISGAMAADKGDKVGGGVTGLLTGTPAALIAGKHAGPLGMVGGAIAGGYVGGKLYSKAKDAFRSPKEREAHRKLNKDRY